MQETQNRISQHELSSSPTRICVIGYTCLVDFGTSTQPRFHTVNEKCSCSCSLEETCPAIEAVAEYLRNGGQRAPDPMPPCPICGADTAPAGRRAAQEESTPTPTPTETPTPTSTGTETPTPTSTATPTSTPTPTVSPASPLMLMGAGTPTEPPPAALVSPQYIYDGDNNLVKAVVNGVITFYPGRHYNLEVDGETETVKKFYAVGGLTIAVRTVIGEQDTLHWILSDHLGSLNVTANEDGTWNSEIRYTAFGEVRWKDGITPTEYRFTGQLEQSELGLYFYVARWYDPYLNHFIQADTIVPQPGKAAGFDRYGYTLYNPIRYNDPSGHDVGCPGLDGSRCYAYNKRTPQIVSRDDWGAQRPGSIEPVKNALMDEGLYSKDNPEGYMSYSIGLPDYDLSEILNTVVIHHEGDDATYNVQDLQRIEMENGYYDLPYHYAIASDGTIYEGRDIGVRGAHVASGNTGKIGIIWLGDFNPGYDPDRPGLVDARDDFPTIAQYSTTVNLIVWLNDEKGANYGIDDFGGHSDFNQTSCPGLNTDLFMRVIRNMFPLGE